MTVGAGSGGRVDKVPGSRLRTRIDAVPVVRAADVPPGGLSVARVAGRHPLLSGRRSRTPTEDEP